MLQAELKRLVDGFLAEHGDMGLERLDGEEAEYDRMREALESMPFLAAKKLVILRTPSANKQFTEKAADLLAGVPDSIDVVIVEPKLDKRSSYYKLLKKVTDFKEFPELDENALARWLVSAAKEQGGQLDIADARLLVQRLGVSQQLLGNELQKLILHNPHLTKEVILSLTEPAPQSTVFDLLEAALNGKTEQALQLYKEQRQLKVEPVQIMALLGWQLHVLALIKTAGSGNPNEIASAAKLNPYTVRKSQPIAAKLSLPELKKLIQYVHKLDVRLKSESIDPDEAMQFLIIKLGQTE